MGIFTKLAIGIFDEMDSILQEVKKRQEQRRYIKQNAFQQRMTSRILYEEELKKCNEYFKRKHSPQPQKNADKPQWISIKDRLPKNGDEVILYNTTYNNMWRTSWSVDCENEGFINGATYWMLLPEPPEEESEEI